MELKQKCTVKYVELCEKITNDALECLLTYILVDLLAEAAVNIWQGEREAEWKYELMSRGH